ncbi:hypothetical protein Taro_041673 [Colocasia esculenta]|uniref:RING-type E3 ubiquitin transferase n=1 Tax=Colocasia esculenta TaxID=4460 RepID=A0A843WWI2_COLES|nr:hypothetical protein [Colocasia esculenta]
MFSGLLPAASLLESLIHASDEVASMGKHPFLQARNVSCAMRRIELVSFLFEELREKEAPLSPSSVLCLTELLSAIRRTRALVEECAAGSALWGLLQTEAVSQSFHGVAKVMGRALDALPLGSLGVSTDVREQVELLRRQAGRAGVFVDPQERWLREELVRAVLQGNSSGGGNHSRGFVDCKVREIAWRVGLRSSSGCDEEIGKLQAEMCRQAGTGGLVSVCNIKTLISMVSYWKSLAFTRGDGGREEQQIGSSCLLPSPPSSRNTTSISTITTSTSSFIPDEFMCPITLEVMTDPVIVASGHTYERSAIAGWINSGHHTCPKNGRRLVHLALIPNYALRSLIYHWCQENNTSPAGIPSPSSAPRVVAVDYISAVKDSADAVKMTAEFLVGKLATGSPETQRQAAYELRLLAKSGMEPRRIIAEAGAIPFLVTLLGSSDPRTQENAVTALLNLSIFSNNKRLILSAGAVDGVVKVLRTGASMEARENAAATLFSLSMMMDECKAAIGSLPGAIHGLLGLLREGTAAGKRDAAMALYILALCGGNRAKVVAAGAVPLLVELLMDDKAGVTDDALALLAVLSRSGEALEELAESEVVLPMLVELLRLGTPRGKENAVCVLLGLCRSREEEMGRRLLRNPQSVTSLQGLVSSDGSPRARRKAETLLRMLSRYQ